MLKFMNGDLYSIDKTPVSIDAVKSYLVKDELITPQQSIRVIDPEFGIELDPEVDILEGDTIYPILVQNPFFLHWIDPKKLDWQVLSEREYAIPFLQMNEEFIDWTTLCGNPHPEAIQMIEQEIKNNIEVCWYKLYKLCENPGAVRLLKEYPDKVDWIHVLRYNSNPEVMPILLERFGEETVRKLVRQYNVACFGHPDAVSFIEMFKEEIGYFHKKVNMNPSPDLTDFISRRFHSYHQTGDIKMVRDICSVVTNPVVLEEIVNTVSQDPRPLGQVGLNLNPLAIPYLKKYRYLIDLTWLSSNQSPDAIELIAEQLEKYPNEVDWATLSNNPHAISLLEQHKENIHYPTFYTNPHPRALEMISQDNSTIDYRALSTNPGIFLSYHQKE